MKRINNLVKKYTVLLHDIVMIPIAWYLAYWLRFNFESIPDKQLQHANEAIVLVVVVQVACYWVFGLYRGIWRFASMPDLFRIIKSVASSVLVVAITMFIYDRLSGIPRSVLIIYFVLLILLLGGSRFIYRWFKDYSGILFKGKRVLIIGSGKESEALIRSFRYESSEDYQVVALLSSNIGRIGREIQGVRVVGQYEEFEKYINKYGIDLVVIAAQDISSDFVRQVVNYCESTQLQYRVLPTLSQIASGQISISDLREVAIEDLLGREEVKLDQNSIKQSIENQVILVTGGGGSIGSELCRQIINYKPKEVIVIENSEFNLYSIEIELNKVAPDLKIKTYLCDIADEKTVNYIFQYENPSIVFHAAAYKHVPLLEHHADSAILNNVMGTYVVANCAMKNKVNKFILISTDKAVNPTNVMGATKRIAEMLCQHLNKQHMTKFIIVRFGNVLGSRGSVIPLFTKQLQEGGPLTVTHPEIERFFMTIPEACQLILQAMQLGEGGEIFVLDMGEPIKIRFLAEQMIKLAGKTVGKDINIIYTGLRLGEKLYEELFYKNEQQLPTKHKKIFRSTRNESDLSDVADLCKQLRDVAIKGNQDKIRELLLTLVPEYQANN